MALTTSQPSEPGPAGQRPDPDLSDLETQLTGRVLLRGTDEYARAATPWNVAVAPAFVAAVEV